MQRQDAETHQRQWRRRDILRSLGATGTIFWLAGCTSAAPTQSPPASAPQPTAPAATPKAAAPTAAPAPPTAAAAAPTAPKALEKVTFRLNWLAAPNHSGFYLAAARGYYKDAGLDVQILEGQGTNPTLQVIAQNKDTFGYATADGLIRAVLQTAPLKAVACITQKGPQAVIARGDAGIKRPEDLAGHTIAGSPGGTGEALLPALLAKANVDPDAVKMVSVDARSKLTLIRAGKVDANIGLITDGAVTLTLEGLNPSVLVYADYGINVLAESIIVNNDWLKQNEDTTRRFLAASLKGWDEVVKDPDAGVQALMQYSKDLTLEYSRMGLKAQLGLLHSKYTEGKPIGWMATEDWQQTQDLLKQFDLIKETRPVSEYFSNAYLPAERR